ncbi:unnamed protein product [Onchocerca ochengi]|uniref:Uncharacterized protein n=1 Tax=Onchocerca ochengi TaxID=42157 RepID=A0A182DZM2_ONCOC|nr:unnamed protein product [Onchocerca ochengi]
MTTSLLWINQLSAIIVISLVQCSSKKVEIKDVKDKDDKKETAKIPVPQEQIKDKQDKAVSPEEKIKAEEPHTSETAGKEKGHLKEAEEKHLEEIKPKIMKRNPKEERIAKGKETRGKGDYPTMDDVLSDWDSEKDGKKKDKEDDDQKSKAVTNLEDVDEIKKDEEQKPMESGAADDKEGISEKKEAESKKSIKGDSKRSVRKVDKTAGSQVKEFLFFK